MGCWIEDEWGLPAYEYMCDQDNDRAAEFFTTCGPSRRHWHQLGNGRLNAIACNSGEIQVMEASRGLQWLNFRDPAAFCPGGGIAAVCDTGTLETDLYFPGAPAAGYRRIFGCGYFRKISTLCGLAVDHRIIAPFGDDPVLLCEIICTNPGGDAADVSVMQFFGVNLHYMIASLVYTTPQRTHFSPSPFINNIAVAANNFVSTFTDTEKRRSQFGRRFRFDGTLSGDRRTVIVTPSYNGSKPGREKRSSKNYCPLPMFLSMPGVDPGAIITAPAALLERDGGFRKSPPARKYNLLEDGAPAGNHKYTCLCCGSTVTLAPGETRTLRFLYGCAEETEIAGLVNKYSQLIEKTEKSGGMMARNAELWSNNTASFSAPAAGKDSEWSARETRWHSYYSLSAAMRDEYYGCDFVPQGGAYEYLHGFRGAVRDMALYIAGITYLSPPLARELLRYCFSMMTPRGRVMYLCHGYGKTSGAIVHEDPTDLQLFLFWAVTEYVFFTGDRSVLDAEVRLQGRGGERASVRDLIPLALDYLYGEIGLGRHGLVRVGDGDWSDGISLFVDNRRKLVRRGESLFNSALALYAMPRLADLMEEWAPEEARRARGFADALRQPVLDSWNGKWFYRMYDGDGRPVGDKRLFLEHHTWLLISRVLPDDMAASVIRHIYKILDRPSPFGQYVLYPPMKTQFDQFAPGWDVNGGTWFAMSHLLTWAYGIYDAELGWHSFRKNSLAMKATVDPHIWYGIWSGPDSYNADHAPRPGETFFHLPTPGADFPVMNLNLHACNIAALVKLCGIEPHKDGVTVKPLLPFDTFSLKTPALELNVDGDKIDFKKC